MKEFIFITIILHIILRLFNNVIKYFKLNQINGFYHTHFEKENIYLFYRVFLKSHRFRNVDKVRIWIFLVVKFTIFLLFQGIFQIVYCSFELGCIFTQCGCTREQGVNS